MKRAVYILIFLLLAKAAFSKDEVSPEITVDELYDHIEYLAADSLMGREPGTPGDIYSAEYIRHQLRLMGLEMLSEDGFQYFEVTKGVTASDDNEFLFTGYKGELFKDFVPLSFSANASLNADVVFAGYGIDVNETGKKWLDYEGIDVNNKWVMIFLGDPEYDKRSSGFESYRSQRSKVLTAKDKGAAGVIFVAPPKYSSTDDLIELKLSRVHTVVDIPVISITREVADKMLSKKSTNVAELEKQMTEEFKPKSFDLEQKVDANTHVDLKKVTTQNVVALLKGNDPELSKEYIVIGAHYDHLGMGGPESGSRKPDTIAVHNGADDNASGVAAILEAMEYLSANRNKLKRSVVFAAFGAEEMGLLGSNYFVENPPVPLKDIIFMVNLDMIGRIDPEKKVLTAYGTGTAEGLSDIVTKKFSERDTTYKVNESPEGYGPTDHASFYGKDISVLSFFGIVHTDYHTPEDDIEFLNFDGIQFLSSVVADIVMDFSTMPAKLAFKEAGPKTMQQSHRTSLKATLGIMPDFANSEIEGLRVAAVTQGNRDQEPECRKAIS
jgi:aminopeptidase YwaD